MHLIFGNNWAQEFPRKAALWLCDRSGQVGKKQKNPQVSREISDQKKMQYNVLMKFVSSSSNLASDGFCYIKDIWWTLKATQWLGGGV